MVGEKERDHSRELLDGADVGGEHDEDVGGDAVKLVEVADGDGVA